MVSLKQSILNISAAFLGLVLSGCYTPELIEIQDIKCLGHRGNVTDSLMQNSMPAFLSALNIGGDGIEFDVVHTKDNIPIVFHDRSLNRLTKSRPGKYCRTDLDVADLTFSEIIEHCTLTNGEEIPSLEDVLATFQPTDFNLLIEFKEPISSLDKSIISQYYSEKPNNIQSIVNLAYYILDPLKYRDFPTKLIVYMKEYSPGMEFGTDGVDVSIIGQESIERLQYLGKTISLHVLNDRASITKAFQIRADLITTDTLELCIQIKQELS